MSALYSTSFFYKLWHENDTFHDLQSDSSTPPFEHQSQFFFSFFTVFSLVFSLFFLGIEVWFVRVKTKWIQRLTGAVFVSLICLVCNDSRILHSVRHELWHDTRRSCRDFRGCWAHGLLQSGTPRLNGRRCWSAAGSFLSDRNALLTRASDFDQQHWRGPTKKSSGMKTWNWILDEF